MRFEDGSLVEPSNGVGERDAARDRRSPTASLRSRRTNGDSRAKPGEFRSTSAFAYSTLDFRSVDRMSPAEMFTVLEIIKKTTDYFGTKAIESPMHRRAICYGSDATVSGDGSQVLPCGRLQ